MELSLTPEIAGQFARIALGHVGQEYPNQPMHAMARDADAKTPSELHPAFYGSYDWHSCVHSWWLLLRLRRYLDNEPEVSRITQLADATFTEEKLAIELAYFDRPISRGWERPYGWAWFLYLHDEAARHTDQEWGARLEPLALLLANRLAQFLPLHTYPITVGTHYNSAFALTLARDWAARRDPALVTQIDEWSHRTFAHRRDYAGWEPGGDEFLSPVLSAALLMSRVMTAEEFAPWFEGLVITNGWLERECQPVTVSDRSDGKIAHLDGLNLSRAWCLLRIEKALGSSSYSTLLKNRARTHLGAALGEVEGDYMGEHWLASFALLALLETP